jgi:RNA polymerase sigma factor (sigma-70 family)
MTANTWAGLRALLVDRYADLKHRLARRLGSTELAAETLQETWLRLDRPGAPGPLDKPDAYVFRVALNIAADRLKADRRRLALSEVETLLHIDDDQLDPERITQSRAEIAELATALDDLSPRARAVFVAARLDGIPHKVIAERHGISVRMVERELRQALSHCAERLGRISAQKFGSRPPEQST